MALIIPNAEIKEIFLKRPLLNGLMTVQKWNRNALFDAVWNGDSERITKEMNSLLRRTISYHDYKEDFYHAFLAGIFTAPDIWWTLIKNMAKGGVMWSFTILSMHV